MREKAGADRPVILIDLDNTILDFNTAEHAALTSRASTVTMAHRIMPVKAMPRPLFWPFFTLL